MSEEAVGLYRRLDAAKHEHNLARALVNLSKWHRCRTHRRSVDHARGSRRDLSASHPVEPFKARAQLRFGAGQPLGASRGSERKDEALAAAEDALTIRRRLAAADPAYERDLAQSLHLLSKRLAEVQRMDDALAAGHDAVNIRRRLAAADPAGTNPTSRTR